MRAGTGGEEAALWAADLVRMYQRYADTQGWKVSFLNSSEGENGGFREAVLQVSACSSCEFVREMSISDCLDLTSTLLDASRTNATCLLKV